MAQDIDTVTYNPPRLQGVADSTQIVGPLNPFIYAPVYLRLSGNWTGSVTLKRSLDGGTTFVDVATKTGDFDGVVNCPTDLASTLYLSFTVVSGRVTYCLEQRGRTGDALAREIGTAARAQLAAGKVLAPYTGILATRGRVNASLGGTYREALSRSAHIAMDDITSLQLIYGNYYCPSGGNGEQSPAAAYTYSVAVEYPIGQTTRTRVTWDGGATSKTVTGAQNITSDAVAVSIPRGALFKVWVFVQCSLGIMFSNNNSTAAGDGSTFYTTTGNADTTVTGTGTSGSTGLIAPIAIIGTTQRRSFLVFGDSNAMAQGESSTTDENLDVGPIERIIGPDYAYANVAHAGSSAINFLTTQAANTVLRRALIPYCSDAFFHFGTNDLAGNSASAVETGFLSLWAIPVAQGKRIWQTTVMPKVTSSTDSYATNANQTIDSTHNGRRITLNADLRYGRVAGTVNGVVVPPPYLIELADQVEDVRDSGKWISTGAANYATSDGIHVTGAVCALAAKNLRPEFLARAR